MQQPFRLDDLSFFGRALADEHYTRTVFAGRGLLFLARPVPARPHRRVHLAFFAPVSESAWLVLLPHHHTAVPAPHGTPRRAVRPPF
ncbi:hypothetical protein [Streptomyces sp. NPDC056069]|uniref:hypothetical protein n=1 Tax=Streptomyces sp. NPDC056069 TaxID=3345702 RepID=UPI0035D561B7